MAQTKAMHTNSSRSVAAQQTARNASSTAATAWPCRLATGALGHFLAMMVSAGNAAHLSFLAPETLVVRSALKMDSSNRGALTARSAWHGGRGMHASCSPVLAGPTVSGVYLRGWSTLAAAPFCQGPVSTTAAGQPTCSTLDFHSSDTLTPQSTPRLRLSGGSAHVSCEHAALGCPLLQQGKLLATPHTSFIP